MVCRLGLELALQIDGLHMYVQFLPSAAEASVGRLMTLSGFLGARGTTSLGFIASFSCKSAFTTTYYVRFLLGFHVKTIAWWGLKVVGHEF